MADLDELRRRFRTFSESCRPRAPLYVRLGAGIADDPDLPALMLAAPAEQHNPVLLLNAVHDIVLRGDAPDLAAFYPNLNPDRDAPVRGDPLPLFRATALTHADEVRAMLAVRRTQTNEIGRCATLLPALGLLGAERGPLAHLDVGTSAGLNLLLSAYHYRYEPGGEVGAPSPITLTCGVRGDVPIPAAIPEIATSLGLDSEPIDVADDDAVRWLEACVWPDQADRFDRLRAAVALARRAPPTIRRGDAILDLVATLDGLGAGHPVVTTTWVLNYLTTVQQRAFVDVLDGWGRTHDLSWLIAESPAETPGLDLPTTPEPERVTAVVLNTWRDGRRTVTRLGVAHPHGYWLHWESPTGAASRPPW